MSTIKIGPGGEKGGRVPVAFTVHTAMPECINLRPGQFLHTHYDCEGKLISTYRTWKCVQETKTGTKVVEFGGYVGVASENYKGDGVMVDVRSLEAIKAGCCPPQIMEGFIRKERFHDIKKDAAEEAIKLHKRSYFGGGG